MKTLKTALIVFGFVLFFLSAVMLFEPNNNLTGFFVYVPNLAIINNDNSQPLNSNLEISFMTGGTNDLTITPLTGEMRFIELRCDDKIMIPAVDGNKIIYEDYHCQSNGFLLVKLLSKELNLEFKFGSKIQQVKNIAS